MTVASFSAAEAAIRAHAATEFAALSPAVPVAWPNAPFEKPNASPWARLTVLKGQGEVAGFGAGPLFRFPGVVVVQIFTPAGQGDGEALRIADSVFAMFQNRRLSGVVFKDSPPSMTVADTDGAWHQLNVACPFRYDIAP